MRSIPTRRTDLDPRIFVRIRRNGGRLLIRRGYEDVVDALIVVRDPVGRTGGSGRRPHPIVELESGHRVVVRRYLRGGLLRHLNADRYFLPGRAFREALATEHAARAGVRVPTVVAAAEQGAGLGYRARLATLWLEGFQPLAALLGAARPVRRGAILTAAGQEIARLHDAGIDHADLNLGNLLVRDPAPPGGEEICIIDFDRARVRRVALPAAPRRRNLRRLARSARKLGTPFDSNDWNALRAGYGSAWPIREPRP